MIRQLKNFCTKEFFCFYPSVINKQAQESDFQDIWLNIASDFDSAFQKIRDENEKRN